MQKFIILYQKGLYGAIVGTESGEIFSITRDQLQNEEWMRINTSGKLKVFKIPSSDEVSNSFGTMQFIPEGILDASQPIKPEIYTVRSDRFIVVFNAYFSKGTDAWVIQEKPFIQP